MKEKILQIGIFFGIFKLQLMKFFEEEREEYKLYIRDLIPAVARDKIEVLDEMRLDEDPTGIIDSLIKVHSAILEKLKDILHIYQEYLSRVKYIENKNLGIEEEGRKNIYNEQISNLKILRNNIRWGLDKIFNENKKISPPWPCTYKYVNNSYRLIDLTKEEYPSLFKDEKNEKLI